MKNNRKISFLLSLILVFTPILVGATQTPERPTINSWWYTPYSAITSICQKVVEKAKAHPYITWGLGIGTAVAAVLSVAGYRMVQANNLAEKRRLKKEKKIGIKPSFKYTASMAHLALIVDGGIVFEPKRSDEKENPWLWNDGKLSQNEKEYTVTYNNKSYASGYNNQTKKWEATTENQMSYLEYYDYLKKTGTQEAFVVFVKYLVGKAVAQFDEIFLPASWQIPYEKVSREAKLATLVEVILTEEKYNNEIVFYHGHRGTLSFLHDFISTLHECLDGAKETMCRSRFEGYEQYASSDAYIEKHGDKLDRGKGHTLVSCNTALFGNAYTSTKLGETTLNFFYCNLTVFDSFAYDAKLLAEKIGLIISPDNYQAMLKLYEKYSNIKGMLKQYFISPEYVDRLSYLSLPYGVPYKKFNLLKGEGNEQYKFVKNWGKLLVEKLGINKPKITSETKNKFYSDCLTPSNMFDLLRNKIDSLEIENKAKSIDRLQARIINNGKPFYDLQKAKKCGIQIVDYYTTPEKKKLREDLRKEMGQMVKKIVLESLEKKSLKGGAENTKLVENYNKTGKCEFLI